MREENIDGVNYRIGRMNARQQFNVFRRLAPVLSSIGPALKLVFKTPSAVENTQNSGEILNDPNVSLEEVFGALGPLATAIGELSDESSDYIIGNCLSVCQINKVGTTWAALATPSGQIMFQDLSLKTMLRLTVLTLQENLSDFFSVPVGSLSNGQ